MTEFRRAWFRGATWFFTVNLAEWRGNRLLVERIDVLRNRVSYRSGATPLPPGSGCNPAGSRSEAMCL